MKFLSFLDSEMVEPLPYGWFHLMCFAIVIALCVLCIAFRKKFSAKSINIIMLVTGIVMILFEVYKQVIMNFDNGAFEPYAWYIFPFQFCSTPMYLMLLAGILRKGKVYDCVVSYLGTFALFAGLRFFDASFERFGAFIYPSSILISSKDNSPGREEIFSFSICSVYLLFLFLFFVVLK